MKRGAFRSVVQMAAADSNEARGTKGVASWKACILIRSRTSSFSFLFLLEKKWTEIYFVSLDAHFLH